MSSQGNISSTNTFEGGLVADLHVLSSPSNTVTHALNMELVTIGENQYIFQNIKGNKHILNFPEFEHPATLVKYQYIPLGVRSLNNIAYILLGAFMPDGTFLSGGIGTFPSPNWKDLNDPNKGTSLLEDKFDFLHNYLNPIPQPPAVQVYNAPFISTKFAFDKNKFIDMDIQGDFDGSVNVIFTDNLNNTRIINSRFKRIETSNVIELANRGGNKDSNMYSENDWDRISLVQNNNFPIKVRKTNAVDDTEEGFEIDDGGYLRGGGYRYYFKYSTPEGNTTDVLYESPLISISNKGYGLTKDQLSNRLVRFYLKNLDSSYLGIRVYFVHFDGASLPTAEAYRIDNLYTYGTSNEITITHSGLEAVTPVDISEINVGFTPIDTVKSVAIINDRLALAGVSSTISEADIKLLKDAALSMTIWENRDPVTGENLAVTSTDYSDANTAAKMTGYWPGEVYEFAVVFMLKNKGLSPAFPITGMDNLNNVQKTFTSGQYPSDVIYGEDGFDTNKNMLINNKGLFRTYSGGKIYTPLGNGTGTRHITAIVIDTSKTAVNYPLAALVSGFFIVRRKRVKNILFQGMAMPTIKLPTKYPSVPALIPQAGYSAAQRYMIEYFKTDKTTIGLNAPYSAWRWADGSASFTDEFDVVFAPSPAPIINVVTAEKSWAIEGGLGQTIGSDKFGKSIDNTGASLDKIHLAIYSPDIELDYPTIKSYLNGISPGIKMQGYKNGESPLAYTYTKRVNTTVQDHTGAAKYSSDSNLILRNAEPISITRSSTWHMFKAEDVKTYLLDSGLASFSKYSFTSKSDRVLGFVSAPGKSEKSADASSTTFVFPVIYTSPNRGGITRNYMTTVAKRYLILAGGIDHGPGMYDKFLPYSIIQHSYSRYMGVEISKPVGGPDYSNDLFNYKTKVTPSRTGLANRADIISDSVTGDIKDLKYLNIGHLVNVYRTQAGEWGQGDIRDIYKYDSNKSYFSASERVPITTTRMVIYRGDCFVTKIFKKSTYKCGVASAKAASQADAGLYGIGTTNEQDKNRKASDLAEFERDDAGRGLFDNGQVVEIVALSNINADIRSVETVTVEEDLLYGSPRDFYPNSNKIFSDSRPDSSAYNHGYTGDVQVISYSRIEESSPAYNTEFPNRILLSERSNTKNFFNSFRDLKGFNYRDYGVELGPIVKIISIKNVLLSIHPTGVLAIGVDDRSLVAEGTNIYVNTAEALSPTAKKISDLYGSTHPESVVKTEATVLGVDYNASAIWLFSGDSLNIISEFAIKTILDIFKADISSGNFSGAQPEASYVSRVYSTFNQTKHTAYISYVAEDSITKEQYHVGTVTYNTVLQKWMSKISEGNKFSMYSAKAVYTTGFIKSGSLWQEDALTNPVGERVVLRGENRFPHEFEIVLNKEAAFEKILNNIRVITNKSLPFEVVYTTSADENDAAINIWGNNPAGTTLNQEIITRNNSPRASRHLGILDENAYYKNSGLYIEVGRISVGDRKARGYKRVRDKCIKVKFIYNHNDETFLQEIITMLSISYS